MNTYTIIIWDGEQLHLYSVEANDFGHAASVFERYCQKGEIKYDTYRIYSHKQHMAEGGVFKIGRIPSVDDFTR